MLERMSIRGCGVMNWEFPKHHILRYGSRINELRKILAAHGISIEKKAQSRGVFEYHLEGMK